MPSGCPSPIAADPAPDRPEQPPEELPGELAERRLAITGDPAADALLARDPFALLIGMLVDQQFPIERAFAAPAALRRRLGPDRFSPGAIAALDPAVVEAAFVERPALHRFPAAMARRVGALARHLVAHHDGSAADVWLTASDGSDLHRRVRALPGFGDEKARIFVALLGKRLCVRPPGWEAASAPFSDDQPRSVADIGSPADLGRVKAWKRERRAQGLTKQD